MLHLCVAVYPMGKEHIIEFYLGPVSFSPISKCYKLG